MMRFVIINYPSYWDKASCSLFTSGNSCFVMTKEIERSFVTKNARLDGSYGDRNLTGYISVGENGPEVRLRRKSERFIRL